MASKEIQLSQGKVAIVDAGDYDALIGVKWYAHAQLRADGTVRTWYAVRNAGAGPSRKTLAMHIVIAGTPPNLETDHTDGDGLNNRRSNLRIVTRNQNMHNRLRKAAGRSSKFRGVSWHKQRGKWQANIMVDGSPSYLGVFASEIEAARAYDSAGRLRDHAHFTPNFDGE